MRCIPLSACGFGAVEHDGGGKWRSLNFAPGKRAHGILMFMSRTDPRSITRSGG